jgi:peptidoglycan/xylan/chitin deacetylase (PgdA/CDA1 family)
MRGRMQGRRLVLAYHGIRPSGEAPAGEHVLHIEQARFNEQLDVLSELARVVPFADILGPGSPEDDRPVVAITWDDAYNGAMTLGLDALAARGMPATVFVSPGRLGGQAFWWDRLAMKHTGTVPAALREEALLELGGDEKRIARKFDGLAPVVSLPEWARSADEGLLARFASRPGVTLASHSWSHPNLEAVDSKQLNEELLFSLRWLEQRFPNSRPWLALPYGLGAAAVRQPALSLGYEAVLMIRGGWLPSGPLDPMSIPRLNVPAGLSTDGFVLRLRGMFCR